MLLVRHFLRHTGHNFPSILIMLHYHFHRRKPMRLPRLHHKSLLSILYILHSFHQNLIKLNSLHRHLTRLRGAFHPTTLISHPTHTRILNMISHTSHSTRRYTTRRSFCSLYRRFLYSFSNGLFFHIPCIRRLRHHGPVYSFVEVTGSP